MEITNTSKDEIISSSLEEILQKKSPEIMRKLEEYKTFLDDLKKNIDKESLEKTHLLSQGIFYRGSLNSPNGYYEEFNSKKSIFYSGFCENGKKKGKFILIKKAKNRKLAVFISKYKRTKVSTNEYKVEGKCSFYHPDGSKYQGEFKQGKFEGKGLMKDPYGFSYDGEWKDGKENGKGILFLPDKYRYEGEWKNGKREGKGVLYSATGNAEYEGD